MNSAREGLSEIGDSGLRDDGPRGFSHVQIFGPRGVLSAGRLPECHLLNAIFNAKSAARSRDFQTPPAAQTESRVSALAEEVTDAVVGESHVYAVHRQHDIAGALSKTRARDEGLDVRHVAAEVPHHAEGMRKEGFHVEVRETLDPRRILGLICAFPASEPHLVQAVDEFTDLPILNILFRSIRGRGEMVVEITSEVKVFSPRLWRPFLAPRERHSITVFQPAHASPPPTPAWRVRSANSRSRSLRC